MSSNLSGGLPITPSTLPASRFSSFCHTTIAPRESPLVLGRWKNGFSLFFSQPLQGFPTTAWPVNQACSRITSVSVLS